MKALVKGVAVALIAGGCLVLEATGVIATEQGYTSLGAVALVAVFVTFDGLVLWGCAQYGLKDPPPARVGAPTSSSDAVSRDYAERGGR